MRREHLAKLRKITQNQGSGEYLYHSSPKNLDILSGKCSKTPDADDHVFVSPYHSFVAPFLFDSPAEIVDKIEKQIGKQHIKINNMRYSSWGSPNRGKSREKLTVYVDTPEDFEPFDGEATGWLYRVALSEVADKLRRWKHSAGEFDEYIIPGDVKFEDKTPETVKFRVVKDK